MKERRAINCLCVPARLLHHCIGYPMRARQRKRKRERERESKLDSRQQNTIRLFRVCLCVQENVGMCACVCKIGCGSAQWHYARCKGKPCAADRENFVQGGETR